jgi:bifunctional non-homologous end joining protein LigD
VPPRQSTHRSPARFIARTLKGAKPAPFPGFVEPCLATLKDEPPAGPHWVNELKLDGYRAQAAFHDARATVYSRRGNDWTARFRPIAEALRHLPAHWLRSTAATIATMRFGPRRVSSRRSAGI